MRIVAHPVNPKAPTQASQRLPLWRLEILREQAERKEARLRLEHTLAKREVERIHAEITVRRNESSFAWGKAARS